MNSGFVPILETPDRGGKYGQKHYLLFESRIIMDYLESAFPEQPLYRPDPLQRAEQHYIMSIFDSMQAAMYGFIMTRGEVDSIVATLAKAFDKLELFLEKSKTDYFQDSETYTMVDLYGFPHTSRIFYLKDSALEDLYIKFAFEQKYPNLHKWFKKILAQP